MSFVIEEVSQVATTREEMPSIYGSAKVAVFETWQGPAAQILSVIMRVEMGHGYRMQRPEIVSETV